MVSGNSWRVSGVLGMVGVALFIGGCASLIAPLIVAPQWGGQRDTLEKTPGGQFLLEDLDAYISVRRRVAVGPPPAKLAVAVIPPGHYSLTFGNRQQDGCRVLYLNNSAQIRLMKVAGHVWLAKWLAQHHMTEAQARAEAKKNPGSVGMVPAALPSTILRHYRMWVARLRSTAVPRGTVILLAGYGDGMLSMMPWALLLGQAGYQSILVDLRAQGESTGQHVTYGVLESRDLVQLVKVLRKAGLIRGRLALLGDSLGAATALLAAPHISHLAAVVAISPFARATTAIPRYARRFFWYAHLIPASSWRAAERKAGRIAGVSLAKAAPVDAAPKIRAPVLYLQGGRDKLISWKEAHELATLTPDSDLLMYPKLGHLQMTMDYAQLAQPVIDWYNRYLARSQKRSRSPSKELLLKKPFSLNLCGG
jgi:alpha-beta hydrolase superfamily lysophospholipase